MAKGKKEEKGLVVVSNIPSMMDMIVAKEKAIKHITESVYKTSGELEGFGSIKSEGKVANLIRAYSMVEARETAYVKAAKSLGQKAFPQFTMGGTLEDWKHDIKLRIDIINNHDEIEKLKGFKQRVTELMDKEDKMAVLEAEMREALG